MAHKHTARPVFDAPVHVIMGRDGTVSLFLPDGHRVVLTVDAAIRSGAMLSRARQRVPTGEVIAADFRARRAAQPLAPVVLAPSPLGKADQAAYMAHHHGPTDSSHVRQEENRRRKPARAVRLPH